MARKPKKLEDLFHDTLKEIYFAEKKILKTLPKMERPRSRKNPSGLRQALAETKGQVERLDRVFEMIGKPARGKTCPAINGMMEEGRDHEGLQGNARPRCRLLAGAQAVEHYEISRYGTLFTWAEQLG